MLHRHIDRVDAAHPVEAPNRLSTISRAILADRGAADHAGIAALRHDWDRCRSAQSHGVGNLLHRCRAQYRRGTAAIKSAPILAIGRGVGRIGQHAALPEPGAQPVDQPVNRIGAGDRLRIRCRDERLLRGFGARRRVGFSLGAQLFHDLQFV